MRKYRAFISYSHADEVWGRRLHRQLEGYAVPRALRGTEGRDGPVPRRLFPIFRDREELPTSADLGGVIRDALDQSDYLVVICSPRSAASKWVNEEILSYKRLGRSNRILALIVDGVPGASDIPGHEAEECFPAALRLEIGDDGELTGRPTEPIAADARASGDGWTNAWMKLAAGLLGVDYDALRQRDRKRKRVRAFGWGVAAAGLLLAGGLAWQAQTEAERAREMASRRAAALEAVAALDRGDERAALAAVAAAVPAGADLTDPRAPIPAEARVALTRTALETRLLADFPAPATDVERLILLPDGVLSATEPGGRTHLIDPATGDATTVYDPSRWTHTRISADGETLWTAHFEDERRDEGGEWYAPLLFEEAELATGEVRLATAVRSVAAYGGSADISPDGALFAVDLGPGEGEETVIAAFRREAQALAGLLTLPSDRAEIWFVGPDVLLAMIDPPSPWAGAPGLYLWRVGAPKPLTLRAPGVAPVCPGAGDVAPEEALQPVLALTPAREEAVLSLGTAETGCLLRWSLPDGAPKPAKTLGDGPRRIAALGPEGPYLFGDSWWMEMRRDGGDAVSTPLCGSGPMLSLGAAGARPALACAEAGEGAFAFGASAELGWRGRMHDAAVAAMAHDPAGRRLYTIGADGRLRVWDAAPRSRALGPADRSAKLRPRPGGGAMLFSPDLTLQPLDASGAPLAPPRDVPSAPEAATEVAARPLAGALAAVFQFRRAGFNNPDGDGAANAVSVLDMATGKLVGVYRNLRSLDGGQPAVSPGRSRFITVGTDGAATLGDGETGAALAVFRIDGAPILAAAVAGGRVALLSSNDADDPAARAMRLYEAKAEAGGAARLVAEWPGQSADMALGPDGRVAAVFVDRLEGDSSLIRVDLGSGDQQTLATSPYGASLLRVGPGGRVLFAPFGSGEARDAAGAPVDGVTLFDGGAAALRLGPYEALDGAPAFDPTGQVLAAPGASLRIHRLSDAAEICPGVEPSPTGALAFSPSGRRLAYAVSGERDGVRVLDLRTCLILRRMDARIFEPPVFADEDRLWLALDGELAEATLAVDPAAALASVHARARRLAAPEAAEE